MPKHTGYAVVNNTAAGQVQRPPVLGLSCSRLLLNLLCRPLILLWNPVLLQAVTLRQQHSR